MELAHGAHLLPPSLESLNLDRPRLRGPHSFATETISYSQALGTSWSVVLVERFSRYLLIHGHVEVRRGVCLYAHYTTIHTLRLLLCQPGGTSRRLGVRLRLLQNRRTIRHSLPGSSKETCHIPSLVPSRCCPHLQLAFCSGTDGCR